MVRVVDGRRVPWWFRGMSLLVAIVTLAAACRRGAPTVSTPAAGTLAHTAFTERIGNFFEYTPPAGGKPSRFTIHLTDLADGSPVHGAEVTLTASAAPGGSPTETRARAGRLAGIYLADVSVPAGRLSDIEFRVRSARLDERMTVSGLVTAPPASAVTTVPFTTEQQWAIRMKLAKVEPAVVARQIVVPGRIVPAAGRRAVVAPPVAGLITSGALPRVGQPVGRGETLATLQHIPTAAEAAQVEMSRIDDLRLAAERRRATEVIPETEIRIAHARRELERARQLYEVKAIAQKQLEAAETEVKAAEAAHATAVAQRDALQGSGSRRSDAAAQTTYSVTAPIAGTVTRVDKSPGEQVAAGEAILEIVSLETLWVEVPVFERDLPRLAASQRAAFTTVSLPGVDLSGRLVNRGAVIDPRTRTATLLFEIANPERRLPLGLTLDARLDVGERAQALLVPRQAVLEVEGKRLVYVLRSGEDFERREVVVGDEHGAKVAVVRGLTPGERVVTQGAWQLRQHELKPGGAGAHTHE